MGELSTTLLHDLTDRLAARLQANLDGIAAELAGQANLSLAHTIDEGSADPLLQGALLSAAAVADAGPRPAALSAALQALLMQTRYRDLAQAVSTYVTSVAGGGYASLAAYLAADATRKMHPLAAELFRSAWGLGEWAFTLDSAIEGVFSPAYQAALPRRVYAGADGALAEDTTDAQDAGTADVDLFAVDDHALYVLSDSPFSGLAVALSTLASGSITPTFQYWDGAAWQTLTVTDHSVGFTKNAPIAWTPPATWAPCYKDAGGTAFADPTPRYAVRIARTANVLVTPPVGSVITLTPSPVLNAAGAHLGVPQPPLAILEITAADTLAVTLVAQPDSTRFLPVPASSLRLRALTPIAQDLTVTVGYVNEAGEDAAAAQSAWAAPAALGTKALALTASDLLASVRSAGWTVVTTATEGAFALEVTPERAPAL